MWKKKYEPPTYRDGMAQTNGDPIEDVPEMTDNVNHPAHYTFGTIEVIDVIEGAVAAVSPGQCREVYRQSRPQGPG